MRITSHEQFLWWFVTLLKDHFFPKRPHWWNKINFTQSIGELIEATLRNLPLLRTDLISQCIPWGFHESGHFGFFCRDPESATCATRDHWLVDLWGGTSITNTVGIFCRFFGQFQWTVRVKKRMDRSAGAVFHLFNHYQDFLGGGFKYVWYCFMFTPIWGRFPFWLIFFKWVETTNYRDFCAITKKMKNTQKYFLLCTIPGATVNQ